jgi:hypothetical protein
VAFIACSSRSDFGAILRALAAPALETFARLAAGAALGFSSLAAFFSFFSFLSFLSCFFSFFSFFSFLSFLSFFFLSFFLSADSS